MEINRAIIAVVLSVVIFIGWTYFYGPKTSQQTETELEQPVQETPPTTAPPVISAEATAQSAPEPATSPQGAPRLIAVDNGVLHLVFSETGGRLVSCRLLQFLEDTSPGAPGKELVEIKEDGLAPLGLTSTQGSIQGLDEARFQALTDMDSLSAWEREATLSFRWVSPQGVEVVKRYRIRPQDYLFDLEVELTNRSGRNIDDNLGLILNARHDPKEGGRYAFKGFGCYVDDELHEKKPGKLKEPQIFAGRISWGGYENSYFLQAMVPEEGQGSMRGELLDRAKDKELVSVRFTSTPYSLAAGSVKSFRYKLFFGPKEIDLLDEQGYDLAESINMGWFDIIAKPFLFFLKFIYNRLHNYGLAIIILTVCVKLVFWPLTQKSYKSMKAMRALQPQMTKMREKWKDDKQRLNQEMIALYKSYKVNPMGGCLPMIVQIPVFIALYRLLDYAIELRHAPFWLWINDLSAPDRLFHLPKVPFMEPPYGIPVLTLLMGASMFFQQKMTPMAGDPMQAKMMLFMPFIFTVIFINFPSGLVLYWFINNLLSVAQQMMIYRQKT